MASKKKAKPKKISMALHKEPPKKAPAPKEAPAAFNAVSPITQEQMDRAERAIDTLREEVVGLRKQGTPNIKVEAPTSEVVVKVPPRPRIGKVVIKYDQLGFPSELIPHYVKPAV